MKSFNLTCFLLFCLSFAYGQTTITGNVYDGITGAPLSNYAVTTSASNGSVRTNASGAYSITVSVSGDFHVSVAAQNGKCYREKWTWGRKILDFHLTPCNVNRSRDSIALRSLYDNLSGAAWTNPWNTTQPITTWADVKIDVSFTKGPVEFIGIDNRNLNGTFPTGTTGFSNLIDLFGFGFTNHTNLRGNLPNLINLKQLDYVKIQNTSMNGDPLSSLAGLKNIENLSLRNNPSMATTFPNSLGTDWRNIYNLQLEGINLSNAIPFALFTLPNLQTVALGQNKLTGNVPALASGNSSTIKYLVLNDNDLDSLPNLSGSTNLLALGVKGNKLTFDDIIPNISKFNAATTYENSSNVFVYAPQDSFLVDSTYRKTVGDPLSIDLQIDGALTTNTYTWRKNGVFFRSITTNKLIFTSLTAADAGVYTCSVTNSNAPLLTLQSRNITIQVNPVANTCRTRDSFALVGLYNAAGGANWTNKWILTQPMTTWSGLTFNAQGCLEKIDLFNRGLVGYIEMTIASLSDLKELTLSSNTLSGSLPNEIKFLTKLEVLSLHNNQLSGSLPDIFSAFINLKTLRLHFNQLSGTLPNSLSTLTTLQELALGANKFSGSIPSTLGNLVNLIYLDLGKNTTLTGTLPTSFSNLNKLQTVYLNNNQLTGGLPLGFANTTAMQSLFLSNNRLDTLPFLGNVLTPSQVWIDTNRLTFDDILPNIGKFRVYQYGNQDLVFVDTIINSTTNTPLSIDLKIDGALTTNQYQWYKNGVLQTTLTSNRNKLTFNSLQNTDAGVWTCRVTNPAAPALTLQSRNITIRVNCAASTITQTLTPSVCTAYTSPSGKSLGTTGTYRDTIKAINGCDSILYTINLTVQNTATSRVLTPSVCTAFTSPSGKIFSTTGTYRDTVKTINRCDSIFYTINLTVQNTATRQTINASLCPNQTYRAPSGKSFSTAGTKLDTLRNQSNCDSVYFTINLLIVTPQYQQAATQSVCKGDVYRGKILTRDTVFRDTLRSVGLCDSLITTTSVQINSASVSNLNFSLCVGGSVTVNGVVYNAAKRTGQQTLPAASAMGCDSVINIATTFLNNLSAVDDEFAPKDSANTLTFNVLTNDVFSGNVKVTPLSKPTIGRLDTLGGGRFSYSFPPQANGTTGFSYRLCSVGCPNLCDTATVKININRPNLSKDESLGITPNCVCPNDRLTFSELTLNPDKFPNNEIVIINRWGDVVYRAKPYQNEWYGANEKGEQLPAGTYYYILRLDLANSKIKTGDVTIFR